MGRSSVGYLGIALIVSGCGGGGTSSQSGAGPCVVNYAGPAFEITSVTDQATGLPINQVVLSSVTLNGSPVDPSRLTGAYLNVQLLSNGSLQCGPPCGFTDTEGNYLILVSATGYTAKTIAVSAAYGTVMLGCPANYSNSTKVTLSLSPG